MPDPRVVLITGCSSGIGRCAAETLLSRGHVVYVTARRDASLAELGDALKRFGDRARVRKLDVTDHASSAQLVAELLDGDGRVDALVNNAAFGQIGAVEELTNDQLRRQYEVNVVGVIDLTRRIIPVMRRQRSGRIINVSSVVAHVSTPLMAAYNSSKAALNALTESLRMELSETGIHTILVEPGVIASSFRDNARAVEGIRCAEADSPYHAIYTAWLDRWKRRLSGRVTPPGAVARAIVHAVESRRPRTRYRITLAAKIAPLVHPWLPDRIADRLVLRGFGLRRDAYR